MSVDNVIKEKPILFSTPMIKAILEGRKCQTRRVVTSRNKRINLQKNLTEHAEKRGYMHCEYPSVEYFMGAWGCKNCGMFHYDDSLSCPYGEVGHKLWVRETHYRYGKWEALLDEEGKTHFEFDELSREVRYTDNPPQYILKGYGESGWYKRPSIFLFRQDSRITLEITNIRVERLQDISEGDAQDEGVERLALSSDTLPDIPPPFNKVHPFTSSYKEAYIKLWDKINGKKYPWSSNPWCWVVEFKKL